MARRKGSKALTDAQAETVALVNRFQSAVVSGQESWFLALLEAIAAWRLPEEAVGERRYRYLIGGEAFDWLLLAERLCQGLDGLIPVEEREALLFETRPPLAMGEEEFRRRIGVAKYRAYLNYFYGVAVEEALQMVVAEEVHKERLSRVWDRGQQSEDEAFLRIYGAPRPELVKQFCQEQGLLADGALSLGQYKEFLYWLFKYRLRHCDPARVASDTRKGLAMLRRLQASAPAQHT